MRNTGRIQIGSSRVRSPSSAFGRRLAVLPLAIALSTLVGCSVYPIPDDVTPLKTEEIVRHGRCEMRTAVIDRILAKPGIQEMVAKWLEGNKIAPATAAREKAVVELVKMTNQIVEDQQEINKGKYDELRKCRERRQRVIKVEGEGNVACPSTSSSAALKEQLTDLKKKLSSQLGKKLGKAQALRPYLDVAVVYDFEFDITEENQTSGDLAFKLPLISRTVDADASASLLLTRKGKRSFATQDRWGKLITDEKLCKEVSVRSKNLLYPLGGSIGVDRVVTTFIDLIDQGGSKESFVDTLVFTTEASAGVNASIKLSPVPHAFRLVSAGAGLSGSRKDMHKLTLSLQLPKQGSSEAIFGVDRFEGELDAPFDRPADWRARYNLCVADARTREAALGQLRETAPEIYCIQYADAFDPQYGLYSTKKDVGITVKVDVSGKDKTKTGTRYVAPPSPIAPPPERERRPNY